MRIFPKDWTRLPHICKVSRMDTTSPYAHRLPMADDLTDTDVERLLSEAPPIHRAKITALYQPALCGSPETFRAVIA